MVVHSAGILLYRLTDAGEPQVWIVHMGGPFWARKQTAAWSIPKGEYESGNDPFLAARREFEEEIGVPAPEAQYAGLGNFRQPSGKVVTVFAAETDFAVDRLVSNTFELEWPKGSGAIREFPEVDDARWVGLAEARVKLVRGQLSVLDALTADERIVLHRRLREVGICHRRHPERPGHHGRDQRAAAQLSRPHVHDPPRENEPDNDTIRPAHTLSMRTYGGQGASSVTIGRGSVLDRTPSAIRRRVGRDRTIAR